MEWQKWWYVPRRSRLVAASWLPSSSFPAEPASVEITDAIFEKTKSLAQYKIAAHVTWPGVDISQTGKTKIDQFEVEVIDPVNDYVELLKQVFDFELLSSLFANPSFSFVYDAMNAVTGPYAKAIFVDELQAKPESVIRAEPLEDFGGIHPDPNLTYAADLASTMKVGLADAEGAPEFGAASDGDGDRNMILGKGFFVSPSDSVAIIAANWECFPYFKSAGKLKVNPFRYMGAPWLSADGGCLRRASLGACPRAEPWISLRRHWRSRATKLRRAGSSLAR